MHLHLVPKVVSLRRTQKEKFWRWWEWIKAFKFEKKRNAKAL